MGRSKNRGLKGYRPSKDKRHELYRAYQTMPRGAAYALHRDARAATVLRGTAGLRAYIEVWHSDCGGVDGRATKEKRQPEVSP